MNVLITGGAGYIGSGAADRLLKSGYRVTVLDNLSHGHREAVPEGAEFIEGDIHDKALLKDLLPRGFDALMHFAAYIEAGESMQDPQKYFDNNVVGSHILYSEAIQAGIPRFIFSSTAAVYASQDQPLQETSGIKPTNVYGQTKRMIEEMLEWYAKTKQVSVCVLRYFNAAGASLTATPPPRGEAHQPETHIIPNILQVALGKKPEFQLFGNDYPTPDGTCIRDYIHVDDLVRAHVLALEALAGNKFQFEVFNLGNGNGFSNQEVLQTARKVTGHPIPATVNPRRLGDAARLIASSDKAKTILGWQPEHGDLETIINSAWEWEKARQW